MEIIFFYMTAFSILFCIAELLMRIEKVNQFINYIFESEE